MTDKTLNQTFYASRSNIQFELKSYYSFDQTETQETLNKFETIIVMSWFQSNYGHFNMNLRSV